MNENQEETAGITPSEKPQKKLDPGFSRNLKLIGGGMGGLVLVVALIVLLKSGGSAEKDKAFDVQVSGGATMQNTGELTPSQQAMIRETQLREAAEAARAGKTYIPPDTAARVQPLVVAPQETASTYANAAVAVNQDGVVSQVDERRRAGLQRQLEQLIAVRPSDGVRERVTYEDRNANASASGGAATAGANGAPAASTQTVVAPSAGALLVPGLDIAAAHLSSDLSVPMGKSVYASATINSGPAAGAFLIGTAQVVDEALAITFTTMRLGKQTYPIDAIVLDQSTAANAIAGSVDRRILQRYVLPIALATTQGFFAAKASVGVTAVAIGTNMAVTTPPSTTEQARSAGIAKGMEIAGASIQNLAREPIVVGAPKNTFVGVLFRSPVNEVSK